MTEAVPVDDPRMPPAVGHSTEPPDNEIPGGSLFPGGGLEITWSQDVRLEDVLAAAARRARYLAGEDLPGRGDGGQGSASADGGAAALTAPGLTATGQAALRTAAPRTAAPRTAAPRTAAPRTAAPRTAAPRTAAPRTAAPRTAVLRSAAPRVTRPQVIAPRQTRWGEVGDPLGEEALAAAMSGAGSTVSLAELAGYAILEPGPGLAGWLSSGAAASMDDAALVNSIVSWRKLTSWAQARELQAVAELATRRGAAGKEAPEDPVKKLEASFISSEVALALTLTPTGAEFWMDLAISLTGRLPEI